MEIETWYNPNCTDFSEEQLKHVNLARGVTAVLCVIATAAILFFLLCHKAYSTTFQRVLLYLITGTMIEEIIGALNLEQQFCYSEQEKVCALVGFLFNWAGLTMMSLELGITVCLLCLVTIRIWGVNYCTLKRSKSALLRCVRESMFIILPVLGSFALSIWAYMDGKYGLAGPWCWIKSIDENCHPYDFQFQMLYYWIYQTVGVCGLIVSAV